MSGRCVMGTRKPHTVLQSIWNKYESSNTILPCGSESGRTTTDTIISFLIKKKKPKRTWQWGEKTRFANAGSDISGGQGGNPGMRPSAVFQTDNDDLWRSSCRNALVVLANFSKSYGSRCPKIWQKYQRDSTLRKEVPHLEENIKRHVKQLSQFPRFFSGGPPLHLVAFWRCPWVCFHSFPGSAGSLNHWTGFSLHPWRFLAKELILCVGQSNYRVTVTKS